MNMIKEEGNEGELTSQRRKYWHGSSQMIYLGVTEVLNNI